MKRRPGRVFLALLLLALGLPGVAGATPIDAFRELPPGEQYRQLSLLLLMSGGAGPELLEALAPLAAAGEGGAAAVFSPDDYRTPLVRIVDQHSMLSGAALLLRFAHDSRADIEARLRAIGSANPVLISLLDRHAITEDAIVIRNAVADAIAYSGLADDAATAAHLERYRARTLRVRNLMEYELFDAELKRLTDEAIASVGGKLDAYQRMFDDEVDSKQFDRQFDAAEYIYNRSEKFDEKAGKLTEEIMKSVILSQSVPKP